MGKVWAVMKRDLLRMLRNPMVLLSAIALPLVYLLILGNSLQGPLKGLSLGVVAQDQGPETRRLLGALQAVEHGPGTVKLVRLDDVDLGMKQLHDGDLAGLLVVPPRFSSDLERGVAASAGLFVDNVNAVASSAVEGAVQAALPAIERPLARYELHLGPPEVRPQEIYPRVDYDASLIPGVVVMSIFMATMIAGAFNMVMDRFLGVHEAYLSTPLRRWHINVGVLMSGTAITCVTSAVVLAVGLLATGVRVHGGVAGYALVFAVVVLTGLGMLAMSMVLLGRAGHPRVVGLVNGFLNIILFFPSGALYPIESFPVWLRAFAHVNPEMHAVAALKAVLFRGGDIEAATRHVLFLAGFCAVMLLVSTLTTKRTL
ncbi:MAG TPA: ABC transporter permease [Polyangiaceae bacterium]|nr:ABC transporter permease [Polyangiaceae bacterium]